MAIEHNGRERAAQRRSDLVVVGVGPGHDPDKIALLVLWILYLHLLSLKFSIFVNTREASIIIFLVKYATHVFKLFYELEQCGMPGLNGTVRPEHVDLPNREVPGVAGLGCDMLLKDDTILPGPPNWTSIGQLGPL